MKKDEPEENNASSNYTYILRCADGTFYTGWTTDLNRRLDAHNAGTGAKYTRSRRPVALAYAELFPTKAQAMQREAAIKKLPRKEKEALVASFTGTPRSVSGAVLPDTKHQENA